MSQTLLRMRTIVGQFLCNTADQDVFRSRFVDEAFRGVNARCVRRIHRVCVSARVLNATIDSRR